MKRIKRIAFGFFIILFIALVISLGSFVSIFIITSGHAWIFGVIALIIVSDLIGSVLEL